MNCIIKRDQIDFMMWHWEVVPLSPRDKAMYDMGVQNGNQKLDMDQLEEELKQYVRQNKRGLAS